MRTFSRTRYLFVFVLTLLIFIVGLLSGLVIESKRVISIDTEESNHNLNFESINTMFNLMKLNNDVDCNLLNIEFENYLNVLEDTKLQLDVYQSSSNILDSDYFRLNRLFFLDQVKYWILLQDMKKECSDFGLDVLYFYNTESDCPDCSNQQFVLTYFRKKLDDKFRVFSIDANNPLKDSTINYLIKKHDITVYPTIVIDGVKFTGLSDKNTIELGICSKAEYNNYCNSLK